MKKNRVLSIQILALSIVMIASLAACEHWNEGSNPRDGRDNIPVANAFHIAINGDNPDVALGLPAFHGDALCRL